VTGSLHHIVTGIFLSSLVNHIMICFLMRHECRTRQRSLLWSPWKSFCRDWAATDSTHSCMPGCEIILAVTASWLNCVWILFMWHEKMKAPFMVVFRVEVTFETEAAMLSRESRTNCLTWEVMWCYRIRHFVKKCHGTYIYSPFCILLMEGHTEIEHFWDLLSCGIVCSMKW